MFAVAVATAVVVVVVVVVVELLVVLGLLSNLKRDSLLKIAVNDLGESDDFSLVAALFIFDEAPAAVAAATPATPDTVPESFSLKYVDVKLAVLLLLLDVGCLDDELDEDDEAAPPLVVVVDACCGIILVLVVVVATRVDVDEYGLLELLLFIGFIDEGSKM